VLAPIDKGAQSAADRRSPPPVGKIGQRNDELFLLSTKPCWAPDATVLKSLLGNDCTNDAPERRIQGVQTVGE
jgi:hypothetical protein